MGSLFSPPRPQPVYIPQPVYVPPSSSVAATPAPSPAPEKEAPLPSASQLGLLERSRGILSTVLTGFDGILTKSVTPQGKSLLGE